MYEISSHLLEEIPQKKAGGKEEEDQKFRIPHTNATGLCISEVISHPKKTEGFISGWFNSSLFVAMNFYQLCSRGRALHMCTLFWIGYKTILQPVGVHATQL